MNTKEQREWLEQAQYDQLSRVATRNRFKKALDTIDEQMAILDKQLKALKKHKEDNIKQQAEIERLNKVIDICHDQGVDVDYIKNMMVGLRSE